MRCLLTTRSSSGFYAPYLGDAIYGVVRRHTTLGLFGACHRCVKGNLGYVVIVAWKNLKKKNEDNNSPHYATVRPRMERSSRFGIPIANVGVNNKIQYLAEGFERIDPVDIKFYYNPNQEFRYKPGEITKYTDYE